MNYREQILAERAAEEQALIEKHGITTAELLGTAIADYVKRENIELRDDCVLRMKFPQWQKMLDFAFRSAAEYGVHETKISFRLEYDPDDSDYILAEIL